LAALFPIKKYFESYNKSTFFEKYFETQAGKKTARAEYWFSDVINNENCRQRQRDHNRRPKQHRLRRNEYVITFGGGRDRLSFVLAARERAKTTHVIRLIAPRGKLVLLNLDIGHR
jgi:hypothetical protein